MKRIKRLKSIIAIIISVMMLFSISVSAGVATDIRGGDRATAVQGLRYDYTPVKTVRSTTDAALQFESVNTSEESHFFSLGFGSEGADDAWIIIEFDEPIFNGPGADIRLIEDTWGLPYPNEAAMIYVSKDGVSWTYIGLANNQSPLDRYHTVSEFDLDSIGFESARFVKVQDNSDRSDFDHLSARQKSTVDGFDLNAVLALYVETIDKYDVYFDVYTSGGSVSKSMDTYELGNNTDVEVTPDPGYRFVQWIGEFTEEVDSETFTKVYKPIALSDLSELQLMVDGLMTSTDGLSTHAMLPTTEEVDVTKILAEFEKIPEPDAYEVYFDTYNSGGSVSKSMDTYELGDNTDVIVTVDEGYEFVQWWGQFNVPLEYNDSQDESVPTIPNPEYFETVYLPLALSDLDNSQLMVDGLMMSMDGTATHTMMPIGSTGFITKILAEFKEITVETITITIAVAGNPGTSSATSNGNTATLNSTTSFDILPGAPIDFSVSTAGNRDFDGWDKFLPTVAPNEDTTYTAFFSREPSTVDYDLVVTQDGQGTVNTGEFNNLTGTFVIGPVEAAEGWEFTGFLGDDGEDVNGPNANGDYTINMNADKNVEAVFEPTDPPQALPISLTVNVVGQGNIESYELLSEFGEVTEGEVVTFGPLKGVNGYKFTDIGGLDGDDLIMINENTFNLVMDGSKVIDILFELEEEFLDEEVPKDAPVPQTGGLPSSLVTLFGGLFVGIGIKLRTKK